MSLSLVAVGALFFDYIILLKIKKRSSVYLRPNTYAVIRRIIKTLRLNCSDGPPFSKAGKKSSLATMHVTCKSACREAWSCRKGVDNNNWYPREANRDTNSVEAYKHGTAILKHLQIRRSVCSRFSLPMKALPSESSSTSKAHTNSLPSAIPFCDRNKSFPSGEACMYVVNTQDGKHVTSMQLFERKRHASTAKSNTKQVSCAQRHISKFSWCLSHFDTNWKTRS